MKINHNNLKKNKEENIDRTDLLSSQVEEDMEKSREELRAKT